MVTLSLAMLPIYTPQCAFFAGPPRWWRCGAFAPLLPLPLLLILPPPVPGFDEYQCIFHRFNQPYGARYSWDFRSLCADAGKEYVAYYVPIGGSTASPSASASPSQIPGNYAQRIIFNVCGGVAGPAIAPYQANTATNINMTLPQPHSHGTAIQILDDPAQFLGGFNCPDTDTCDQATNPACVPGTLNYLANRTGTNPNTCDANGCHDIDHNPAMEAVCAGPSPLPAACTVSSTKCTGNIELLSYYDGHAPVFSLFDEFTAGGVTALSPSNGINLTYTPSLAFSDDRFACFAKDARTGEPVVRTVNVYIACDAAGYVDAPLNVIGYTEEGQCQYYVRTSHKLGCGAAGDPYDPAAFPSFAPCPSVAPAAAVAFNLNTQQLVGATVGLVALLTVGVQTLVILLMFCFCVPEATRQASLDAFTQRFCGARPRFAGVATSVSGARSPKAYFRDGHAKTETILPGSAGMFVARAAGSDRFAANPLGALNTAGDRAVAPGATL